MLAVRKCHSSFTGAATEHAHEIQLSHAPHTHTAAQKSIWTLKIVTALKNIKPPCIYFVRFKILKQETIGLKSRHFTFTGTCLHYFLNTFKLMNAHYYTLGSAYLYIKCSHIHVLLSVKTLFVATVYTQIYHIV